MPSFVPSLILGKSCLLSWLKIMKLTWTSICTISRLSGALTETMTTTGRYVCTPIIGKTTEESLQYSPTSQRCAIIGKRTISLELTLMVVNCNTCVKLLMDGRNKNITLTSSSLRSVSMALAAPSPTVPTTTQNKIVDKQHLLGSITFLRAGLTAFTLIFTYLNMGAIWTIWPINKLHSLVYLLKSFVMKVS